MNIMKNQSSKQSTSDKKLLDVEVALAGGHTKPPHTLHYTDNSGRFCGVKNRAVSLYCYHDYSAIPGKSGGGFCDNCKKLIEEGSIHAENTH